MKRENDSGGITRQEAVSMVPPLFLDVQPHHRVRCSAAVEPLRANLAAANGCAFLDACWRSRPMALLRAMPAHPKTLLSGAAWRARLTLLQEAS